MRRPRHRIRVLSLAAFQLVATAFVPVADALLELGSAAEPVHVEAERATSCGDPHDHLFCQSCRSLSVAGVPRHATERTRPAAEITRMPEMPLDCGSPAFLHSFGPVGSRPPPPLVELSL